MNALDNDMYNELEGRCLYISGGYPSSTAKMQPNHGEPWPWKNDSMDM